MPTKLRSVILLLLSLLALATPHPAHADTSFGSAIVDYFTDWFPRVTRIQSEQPHWVTPLTTTTPRLEEEYRYDQFWQSNKLGLATDNYGGGKGLELIPFQNTEIILGVPAWIAHTGHIMHSTSKKEVPTDGWADETFLIKYRLLSANEEQGNYIVTAFMGFSAPTGDDGNSAGHALFTPTIAAGKGWFLGQHSSACDHRGAGVPAGAQLFCGTEFDVQSTLGVTFPNGGEDRLGWPVVWNSAFQLRLFKYFWPELETNYTWFAQGKRTGQNQLYLTPGILLGRFPLLQRFGIGGPIQDRLGLTIGAGYQVAVTHHPTYNNAVILSARLPF